MSDSHLALRPWRLAGHMVSRAFALVPLGVGTLGLGMAIYHWVEGLGWPDAFLNAAMLLGGMGPVNQLTTDGAKVFASGYALFSGLIFIGVMGLVLAPVVHRIIHHFHVDERDLQKKA